MNLIEAAAFLGVTPRAVRLAVEAGKIAAEHPFNDGPWMFNQADLTKARFFTPRAHSTTGRAAIPTGDQSGFDFSST